MDTPDQERPASGSHTIELKVGGATFTCASIEEAVALARALGAIPPALEAAAEPPKAERLDPPTSSAWRQPRALDLYWGRLDSRGRAAIRTIATGEGVSIDQLRDRLGVTSNKAVSQVIAACKRAAKSAGIPDYRDVFTFKMSGARGERVSLYSAGRLLRGEA